MSHSLDKTIKAIKKSLTKNKKKARTFSKSRDVREDRMTVQTKKGSRKK
jgi:hypothetical protein